MLIERRRVFRLSPGRLEVACNPDLDLSDFSYPITVTSGLSLDLSRVTRALAFHYPELLDQTEQANAGRTYSNSPSRRRS